jgi:3-hydroxybutyryl-CoA dehydrogenase
MGVKTIAVIGAGALGRSAALAAVAGGFRTMLKDVSLGKLNEALVWIEATLKEAELRGERESFAVDAAMALISTASNVEDAIRDADLIVETVADELEMKLELFTIFDKFAKPGAIFATTTAALSIADISDVVVQRERCLGMRFCGLEGREQRIELVKAAVTSEETLSACKEVAQRMARGVVVIHEGCDGNPDAVATNTAREKPPRLRRIG